MNVHQLNPQPVKRSLFVEQVAAGINDPANGAFWRGKARQRIRELRMDLMDYGLEAGEEAELEQLEELVGGAIDPVSFLTGALAIAFVIMLVVAIRLVG